MLKTLAFEPEGEKQRQILYQLEHKQTADAQLYLTMPHDSNAHYRLHLTSGKSSKHLSYIDADNDGHWDGDNVDNILTLSSKGLPLITLANIAVLRAFAGYGGGGGWSIDL